MTITGAIVLLAVIWFLTLYMALPIGMRSQADAGEVEPGTPASAPSDFRVGRKLLWVTAITVPVWLAIVLFIAYGPMRLGDFDFFSGIDPVWQADRTP